MIRKIALSVSLMMCLNVVEAKTYGAVMPKGKAIDIAAAVDKADEYDGKEGKFKGRITQVCQAKGCWLMIESNGKAARVMTNDAFFMPKDSKGEAIVFGKVKQVQMKESMVKHLAEDAQKAGQNPEPVKSNEIHVIAASVKIK